MIVTATRETKAPASLNVPRGVSGRQREAYLALTDEQKVIYRYRFDVMGQPAGLALRFAKEGH